MDVSITHYEIYDKLDHIEEELSEYGFFRIHKSYLVNLKHIRKVNNYEAVLDTGESLPIPRRRFQAAKEAFCRIQKERCDGIGHQMPGSFRSDEL